MQIPVRATARIVLAGCAIAFCLPAAAQTASETGQAVRAGLPLIFVGNSPDFATFASAPVSKSRPSSPVEAWRWAIFQTVQAIGAVKYDTIATRYRVDCAASTTQVQLTELYRDGTLARAATQDKEAPVSPKPSTVIHALMLTACDPAIRAKLKAVPDFRAAQAFAKNLFANQGKPAPR